jgi:hypothetical protein
MMAPANCCLFNHIVVACSLIVFGTHVQVACAMHGSCEYRWPAVPLSTGVELVHFHCTWDVTCKRVLNVANMVLTM